MVSSFRLRSVVPMNPVRSGWHRYLQQRKNTVQTRRPITERPRSSSKDSRCRSKLRTSGKLDGKSIHDCGVFRRECVRQRGDDSAIEAKVRRPERAKSSRERKLFPGWMVPRASRGSE